MPTWFDRYIFDRFRYMALKPYHPKSMTAFTLAINPWLFHSLGIVTGLIIGLFL